MLRYIGLIWNAASKEQEECAQRTVLLHLRRAPAWTLLLENKGVAVFYQSSVLSRGKDAIRLKNNKGIVLGQVFKSESKYNEAAQRVLEFSKEESDLILRTNGRHLIDAYWGRYVAILQDQSLGKYFVLRDPTGGMPCFLTNVTAGWAACSFISDLAEVLPSRFSINWDYVAVRAVSPIQSRETGLRGVSELCGGECAEITADYCRTHIYWNVLKVSEDRYDLEVEELASRLQRVVSHCVQAWASSYSRILIRLSGGLDSAVVTSCISGSNRNQDVKCITYFSQHPGDDDRVYAREVAADAGYELLEINRSDVCNLRSLLSMNRFPLPYLCRDRLVDVERLEESIGVDAVFGGEGGDQVFYQGPVMAAAEDLLRNAGLTPRLFTVAKNIASTQGVSIWKVLLTSAANGVRKTEWSPLSEFLRHRKFSNYSLVQALNQNKRFVPTVFQSNASAVPIGKIWHAYWLSFPRAYYPSLPYTVGSPETINPLCSQPIAELCLRIPTYILTIGGWDRGLIRRAFIGKVPPRILWKTQKSRMDGFIKQAILSESKLVKELLMGGLLAQNAVIDLNKLSRSLADIDAPDATGSAIAEVFDLLLIEAWARSWASP